ncbi:Signal transduction histidine kinase [Halorientalis persicus]|uniref:histidine kinase n=1 Tax=Halorientalis persicus TaxID=1367881 RepID=A0A1H8V6V8_9EURY|nr:sensor histidine kinase [Halorientalis persicus]SEP11146.1 Signal transduction histidine kinase [Halorientalis persicus]
MADSSGEEVVFTIDSRLLEELGENLVTRNHVAVGELIKNAYDADATEVVLEFKNAKADDTSDSEIAVIDDGTGMTLEEVRDDFMRIATTNKRRNPISEKFGREKAGDKGIGRFACRRLAHILDITTVAKIDDGVYQRTSLNIDWRDYEADQEIEEVSFPVKVENVTEEEEPGISTKTELRLKNLQESWTEREFNTLRRNVSDLAVVQAQDRPEGEVPDPGFDIKFRAPEFDMGDGSLSKQVHDAGWGCLEGEITEDGTVSLELEAKLIGERSYSFSYETEGLGGTSFKISYIPLDNKEHFRDAQTLSLKQAKEISENQSGVRVYKGGFRVFSYGGPDDDWLGIDRKRTTHNTRSPDERFEGIQRDLELHQDFNRVLLSGPNNRNLVGRVMISSDADLRMAANREEFQENELIDDLREIVRLSLQWMTLQWSHYKSQKSKKELEEKTEEFLSETGGTDSTDSENTGLDQFKGGIQDQEEEEKDSEPVDSAIDLLEGVANTATESVPEEERQVSDEAVDTATKVIKNTIDQKEQEIDFFRSAFSVNQIVFSFSHELRSMVNDLGSSASRIEAVIDDLPKEHQSRFEDVIEDLRTMEDRFESQMELFGIFMETGDRKNAEEQQVEKIVNDVLEATEYIADYYSVEFSTDVPDLLYTPPMYKSELYSVLINLVTNSIKAVGTSTEDENRIHVEGEKTSDGVRIRVCDNGVGIPEDAQEDAFEPLISDPADNIYDDLSKQMPEQLSEQLGRGTGLGLSIVRNIAEKYDGDAQFVEEDDWTTCVEVALNE